MVANAAGYLIEKIAKLSRVYLSFQVDVLLDVSNMAYYSASFLSYPTTWKRLEALGYFESKKNEVEYCFDIE